MPSSKIATPSRLSAFLACPRVCCLLHFLCGSKGLRKRFRPSDKRPRVSSVRIAGAVNFCVKRPFILHGIYSPRRRWGIKSFADSRLACNLTFESESAPVAWVALPGGRGNAAPPYFSHLTGAARLSSASKSSTVSFALNRPLGWRR